MATDNVLQSAQLRETEDQVCKTVDFWHRSKQLVALKHLRQITGMVGRMEDIDPRNPQGPEG